jgi:hypothetical protein
VLKKQGKAVACKWDGGTNLLIFLWLLIWLLLLSGLLVFLRTFLLLRHSL